MSTNGDTRCRAQAPHSELAMAVQVTRFWRLVKTGSADECWPWLGYVNKDNYGIFTLFGKRAGAHEYALSFTTGEIRLDGLDTCHSCDNPQQD